VCLRVVPVADGRREAVENVQLTLASFDAMYAVGASGGAAVAIEDGRDIVSVGATVEEAGEEGPVAGEFTLTRIGSTDVALTVNLVAAGSAVNGTDYPLIPSQIVFPAGEDTVTITVQPYADGEIEAVEVVELLIDSGDGYMAGESAVAQITIEDLPQRVALEVIGGVAVKDTGTPGQVLVTRSGAVNQGASVRLQFGGSAVNGVDYQWISPLVLFNPGETAALLSVVPLATFNGRKTFSVSVLPDPMSAYALGADTAAKVVLLQARTSLAGWREDHFAGQTGDLAVFAGGDSDGDGIKNLQEYAFGLNPTQSDGADTRAKLAAVMRDGSLMLEFRREAAAADLEYSLETSHDLKTWNPASTLEAVDLPAYEDDADIVGYRVRPDDVPAIGRFVRLRVRWVGAP
jgi:hypothetical protein